MGHNHSPWCSWKYFYGCYPYGFLPVVELHGFLLGEGVDCVRLSSHPNTFQASANVDIVSTSLSSRE